MFFPVNLSSEVFFWVLLFNFIFACVNVSFKKSCIRILKPKKYLWKSTLFCLVSKHQVPRGICSSLSKWVLGVSLALTHIEPMFSFGMPWKQKDIKVLPLFQRLPKGGTLPEYGLYLIFSESFDKLVLSDTLF